MAVTQAQLDYVANGALDFYFNKGQVFQQAIQQRPLLAKMDKSSQNFPGGKGNIDFAVSFGFGDGSGSDILKGYSYDDTLTFYNPTKLSRAKFAWREHHIGITLTYTELKNDGISVVSEGSDTAEHSGRDATMLVNLFQNKLFDFGQQYSISMNSLLWGDGTGDAKALAGIRAAIVPNPGTGTYGGFDRSLTANAAWRNRARTAAFATAISGTPALAKHGGGAVTSATTAGGALWQVLQSEQRQLRRFGGNPDTFFAGSDFIGALETEMRANGYYSNKGWNSGSNDGAMGPVLFDGTVVQYDPTLDDLSLNKRGYWFDSRHIFLMKMTNEWNKQFKPTRLPTQMVMYRSVTSTGQLVAKQLNSALVIDIV
jgi:hypothetical protein